MVYRDLNRWAVMDLLFWDLMHLYPGFICCRRCFFDNWCICTALIFIVADTFQSARHDCIYILLFLGFKDTSFANFASTSHVFDNARMLLIEILHPALSITCGYTSSKFYIFNSRKFPIADAFFPKNILWVLFTSQLDPIHYLSKIDIRNSSEYGVSVGDT